MNELTQLVGDSGILLFAAVFALYVVVDKLKQRGLAKTTAGRRKIYRRLSEMMLKLGHGDIYLPVLDRVFDDDASEVESELVRLTDKVSNEKSALAIQQVNFAGQLERRLADPSQREQIAELVVLAQQRTRLQAGRDLQPDSQPDTLLEESDK